MEENGEKSKITQRSLNSKRYSRFDAQVRAIQGDINTYIEEPEDFEDYKKWKSGFGLEEKKEEIERLMEENGEEEEEELSWDVDEDEEEEEVDERNTVPKASLKKQDVDKKEKDETVKDKAEKSDLLEKETVGEKGEKDVLLENKDQVVVEKVNEKNPVEKVKGNVDESSSGNIVTEKVNLEKNEEVCKDDSMAKSVEKVASEAKD
ncbi:hypothetical protein Goshw_026726, partial [Gossypium schwendimanii]|nr:hypothetical protein [Gossypium schwendimanii]